MAKQKRYTDEEKIKILNDIITQIKLENKSVRDVFNYKNKNKPDISSVTFHEWIKHFPKINKEYKTERNKIQDRRFKEYRDNMYQPNPKGSKATDLNDYRVLNARKVNKSKFKKTNYLYIIQITNQDIYKIGVSSNYERRCKDIINCLPYDSEIIFVKEINNAYDIEEYIHNSIKDYYLKSEWFKLDLKQINDVVKYLNTLSNE